MRSRGAVPGAALLLALASGTLAAQTTRLTIAGFSGNIGNTTVADYDQGFRVSASAMTFTTRNTVGANSRATAVYVKANNAFLGGTKPIGDLQWALSTSPTTWNSFTTSNVLLGSQTIAGLNTEWANGIFFKCLLFWTDDPNAVFSVTITFTLQVTAP